MLEVCTLRPGLLQRGGEAANLDGQGREVGALSHHLLLEPSALVTGVLRDTGFLRQPFHRQVVGLPAGRVCVRSSLDIEKQPDGQIERLRRERQLGMFEDVLDRSAMVAQSDVGERADGRDRIG